MTAANPTAGPRTLSGLPVFDLPPELEASSPPEARGLTRDAVRMLVANRHDGSLIDTHFSELPRFLHDGDLVVINTSGTLAAELVGRDSQDRETEVRLSTQFPAGLWTVELRRSGQPYFTAPGDSDSSSPPAARSPCSPPTPSIPKGSGCGWRRWSFPAGSTATCPPLADPSVTGTSRASWPISAYQNVYVTEPGSAEMPSAGRPFTPEVLTRLVAGGVGVTPIVLHTGVASLEASEPPYPEYFRVSAVTADRINHTHRHGGLVIAVGTTVVRALESVVDEQGHVHPSTGWTDTVITADRQVRALDGMLTGWHEPEASHLAMLEAVAGRKLLEASYAAALAKGYLWHEFGDVHLVLP